MVKISNRIVKVRSLLSFSTQDITNGLKTNHDVLFEDGVVKHMTSREIILFRYIMDVINIYPTLPIKSTYVISNFYSNGMYVSKTINKCYSIILEDIIFNIVKPAGNRGLLRIVYETMFQVVNNIFNEVVYGNLRYASSLSILDFLEVQLDQELLDSMRRCSDELTVDSVNNTHAVMDKVIREKYSHNDIGKAYIAGTVNPNQIKQLLGARGYVTEIDSTIFKYPIASSFTLGLSSIYDMATESRSGAKALFLSNKAIQSSEYLSRELQLVCMSVEKLVDGDCGSTDYVKWFVKGSTDGSKSDLKNMAGKHYFDPVSNSIKIIKITDKHLEGTTVLLRTAMKCKHPDKNSVCTTCFGELSYGVHPHASLGHIATTTMTQKISQAILSTKHLATSATSSSVALDDIGKQFFTIKNKDGIAFKSVLLGRVKTKMYLIVDQASAYGIKDLTTSMDVRKLNPARVSRISHITILTVDQKGNRELYPINIKTINRYGNFTYDFLEYIQTNGYTLTSSDEYMIDLVNWKQAIPVIKLPEVEFNFLALSNAVKSEFKFMDIIKGDRSSETQESLLQKVFDLVNSKLDVNIALLEVIIYAFTITSIKDGDYTLGRTDSENSANLMKIDGIIKNRSLGAAYGYERVLSTIIDPKSFIGENRTAHPLDVLIAPNEVLASAVNGGKRLPFVGEDR